MAKNVVVNHWGTILSSKKFKLDENGYIKIIEGKDLVDLNEEIIEFKQYLGQNKKPEIALF